MAMVTLWLSMARGGSDFSTGMSNPAAGARGHGGEERHGGEEQMAHGQNPFV